MKYTYLKILKIRTRINLLLKGKMRVGMLVKSVYIHKCRYINNIIYYHYNMPKPT